MNIILSALILVLGIFGGTALSDVQIPRELSSYDAGADNFLFGATNYPAALDTLTNPSATDSVATVSHSAQHANANDAIEALQAKLGISASTAVANSFLVGNGSGSSIWTTYATSTSVYTSLLNASTTETHTLLANSSTTLQNFTFVNGTGTSATTTNLFANTASTTNFYGAGLQTCAGVEFLQWSAGRFGCEEPSGGGLTIVSTTTQQQLATTTFSVAAGTLPDSDVYEFTVVIPTLVGSASTSAQTLLVINGDHNAANYLTSRIVSAAHSSLTTINGVLLDNSATAVTELKRYITLKITNHTGAPKMGSFSTYAVATTTPFTGTSGNIDGTFVWNSIDDITQIDISTNIANAFLATSTRFKIQGY